MRSSRNPGRLISRTTFYVHTIKRYACEGAMFDYYECQAVIVVHIVSVQSFQLASARKSFEAGLDGCL